MEYNQDAEMQGEYDNDEYYSDDDEDEDEISFVINPDVTAVVNPFAQQQQQQHQQQQQSEMSLSLGSGRPMTIPHQRSSNMVDSTGASALEVLHPQHPNISSPLFFA